MASTQHHSVYVIALDVAILYETKFVEENPDYIPNKPCVYVGLTGIDPKERFKKHKAKL